MSNSPADTTQASPRETVPFSPTMQARRLQKWGQSLLFCLLWLMLMIAGRSAMFRDPGTFWHVVVGDKIISARQLPWVDEFSFTRGTQPWIADQWLAEIAMSTVHRLAGWDGLLTIAAAILAGVYTFIALRMLRAGMHWLSVGAIIALALLASSHQFHVRPLLFTLAGLTITYSLLLDVDAGRKSLHSCWLLVPFFIIWTNLHGGVLFGIGSVVLCVLIWIMFWATGRDSPLQSGGRVVEMLIFILLLPLGLLLNPYGTKLIGAWLELSTMPLPQLIEEHGLIELTAPAGWATLSLGAIYAVVLLSLSPRRLRASWLVPLVFFILAMRVRNAPLFAITAALALPDMLLDSRLRNSLQRRQWLTFPAAVMPSAQSASPKPQKFNWRRLLLPLIVVATALTLQTTGVSLPIFGRGWVQFDSAYWPMDLLPQLEKIDHQAEPPEQRIFNDLRFGGFLIYHTPRLKIFIDDRCPLYGSEFLSAYDHARRDDPRQIDSWQRQYQFHYALVRADSPFDRYLHQNAQWTLLGRSPAASLYRFGLGFSRESN